MATEERSIRGPRHASETHPQGSIRLGQGIVVHEAGKGAGGLAKERSVVVFQIHVTTGHSGKPQAELDLETIGGGLGRIALEDLESVSKKLQQIVVSLKLKNGDYQFRTTGKQKKAIIHRLSNLPVPPSPAGTTASREGIVKEEIENAYSAREVADMLYISPQAVQKKRHNHAILGLKVANRFVYPKWQFDTYGQPISGLEDVLKHLFSTEENTLEVAARISDRRPFLEGRSIKNCLLEGRIEDAIMAAENLSAVRV